MMDVINRGTADQAQGWVFRNVEGKTAFAGKTGTSRDGWFVGFTPDLVCVVYVGFDDNDDLGMKGSDSAMPVWADFMQEALRRYPEWNGDWAMPGGIRKAEIDIRNGSLIRELDLAETLSTKPLPSPTATPAGSATDDPAWATELRDEAPGEFIADVPAEFRRIELFITGTVPSRAILKSEESELQFDPVTGEPIESKPKPEPTATPLDETWEDSLEAPSDTHPPGERKTPKPKLVTVIICPLTSLRATVNCPKTEARTYTSGKEPRDFCAIHR
jgi:penicillin-binding protein 1B